MNAAFEMHALAGRCGRLVEGLAADAAREKRLGPTARDDIRAALRSPTDLAVRDLGQGRCCVSLAGPVDAVRLTEALSVWTEWRNPPPPEAAAVLGPPEAVSTVSSAMAALLAGRTVLLDGTDRGFAFDFSRWPTRQVAEPSTEMVTAGPHVGFTERLEDNLSLLRQTLRDPSLTVRPLTLGAKTGTRGAWLYLAGSARQDLLERIDLTLARPQPMYLPSSRALTEWLTGRAGLVFPVVSETERPDVVQSALREGRVAFLVDGSPVAVIGPVTFWSLLQAAGDYYGPVVDVAVKRTVRLAGLFVGLLATPLLAAVLTSGPGLVPTHLAVSLAQNRFRVPLPPLAELLLMEVVVDLVREAGIRLPGNLGQTVSVLGAVVIGQSAVQAGLISAPVVVVAALAFLGSFTIPNQDMRLAMRRLRLPLIVLGGWLGLFGVTWGFTALVVYMLSLNSFGVPYLSPWVPMRHPMLQDAPFRPTWSAMRPSFMNAQRRRGR